MTTGRAAPERGGARLGERSLTTTHVVAQALAIGPALVVALLLGGVSRPDHGAGWNAALAMVLAGGCALCVGYAVALHARRHAGPGAVYEYLAHAVHPWAGALGAALLLLGALCLGGGGLYLGIGVLAEASWERHVSAGGPGWWAFALLALALVLALCNVGVRLALRAMLALAAVSCVPLFVLTLVVVGKGGAEGVTFSMFDPRETSLLGVAGGGVLGGLLLGVLLFVGFEAAAALGEEAGEPTRSIPRAVLGTLAAVAGFYVVIAFAFSIGFGREAVEEGAWAFSADPVRELAASYVGGWYATLLELVILLDALAVALAACVLVARVALALGRVGLLPSAFAGVSRHGTPWAGSLLVAGGAGVALLLALVAGYEGRLTIPGEDGSPVPLFPSDAFATFVVAVTAGGLTVSLVYLALALTAFRYVRGEGGGVARFAAVAVAAATPALAFVGALRPAPHDRSSYAWEALLWTIVLLLVAAAWLGVLAARRRAAGGSLAPRAPHGDDKMQG